MTKISFHNQIAKNNRNSILLGTIVFSFVVALVYFLSSVFSPELSGVLLVFAIIIMGVYTFGTYYYGDKIVLATTKAELVSENDREYIHLMNTVDGLSIAAGIPRPKVYVIESDEMNAFATGRSPKNASIAVTTGLLKRLKRDELEGVIAHELSHIRNYDIKFATLVAVMVGLIAILSAVLRRSFWYGKPSRDRDRSGGLLIVIGLLLAIFAPIIVRLVQLAISRKREYLADASGVKLTRYPEGLASALEKIMKFNRGKMQVSEAISHLFFVDPNVSHLDKLYATHPPIEKRIEILRSM